MKEKIKQAASVITVLFLAILLGYLVFRVAKGGWHAYRSLSENVQITIAVAILSLVGTLISLYYTKVKDRQLQIEATIRIL